MASKRRLRKKYQRRSCQGKAAHPDKKSAEHQVRRILYRARQNPSRARVGFLNAYHCQFCGKWHVGNTKHRESMSIFLDKLMSK